MLRMNVQICYSTYIHTTPPQKKKIILTINCEKAEHDIINFFTSEDMGNMPSAIILYFPDKLL